MLKIRHWLGIKELYRFVRIYHKNGEAIPLTIIMCTEIEAKGICTKGDTYHDEYRKLKWINYKIVEVEGTPVLGFNLSEFKPNKN